MRSFILLLKVRPNFIKILGVKRKRENKNWKQTGNKKENNNKR